MAADPSIHPLTNRFQPFAKQRQAGKTLSKIPVKVFKKSSNAAFLLRIEFAARIIEFYRNFIESSQKL